MKECLLYNIIYLWTLLQAVEILIEITLKTGHLLYFTFKTIFLQTACARLGLA